MDPDFENTYTMYCGSGGPSESDSNSTELDSDIDRADEQQGYSRAEAERAGVDTSQDSSYDDISTTQNVEVGFQPVETPELSIPQNVSLTTPEMPTFTTPQTPSLTTPETPSLTEPTFTSPSYYSEEPPSESDSEDGITNYTDTFTENVEAAFEAARLKPLVSKSIGTVFSLMSGLPINGLVLGASVLDNYNARVGRATPTASGVTSSDTTSGLLDSNGDSDQVVYQTSSALQNTADSAAIKFLTNVKALSSSERYDLAKAKVQGILSQPMTNNGSIAISSSPYYNFLTKYNLNKGVL